MNFAYLTMIILGVAGQNIAKKPFADRAGGKGSYFFNFLMSIAAALFFLFCSQGLSFDPGILPYAIGFGATYSLCSIFSIRAIACGSLTLSSLVISYSLLVPTAYGLLVLKDPVGIGLIPGIVLLAVSLFLVNKPDKNTKFSFKWLLYATLAFLGNGLCSTIQKMQQQAFDGAYKNEFMILALVLSAAAMFGMMLATERKQLPDAVRAGWYLPVICGVLNGLVNLLVMILSHLMPVSVMFPSISAGGLILTYIVSRFLYRESLTKTQFIGFILGIAAVIALNI